MTSDPIDATPLRCAGLDDKDMDKIEAQENKEAQNRQGKTLGLPEIDPDALPSSLANKYLILGCIAHLILHGSNVSCFHTRFNM